MGKTRIDKDAFMPDDVVIKPSPTPKEDGEKIKKKKKPRRPRNFYLNKDKQDQLDKVGVDVK